MAADALVSGITSSLATKLLTMLDEWVLAFHNKGFQLPVPSQGQDNWEMIKKENVDIFIFFLK